MNTLLLERALLAIAALALTVSCSGPSAEQANGGSAVSSVQDDVSEPGARAAEDGKPAADEPVSADPGRKSRIFVSNYRSDTISVVEGDPAMETKAIPGGDSPHGLALRMSEPPLLAVAHSTGSGVTFIDPDTLEEKGHVQTSPGPQDLVFSGDGRQLYVISPTSFDLNVVDVAEMKTVGEPVKLDKKPRRILFDSSGDRLFVLLVSTDKGGEGAEVAVMDPKTREVSKRVPVGRQPDAMALGNDGRTLATVSFDDSTITVIDTGTLEPVATYPARTGMGLAIHPNKAIAYSCESFDDVIQVLDLETGKEIKTISAGAWPTYPAFGTSGRYLYVPHEQSDSVVKIDTDTNQVVAKIAVGRDPIELAIYDPNNVY